MAKNLLAYFVDIGGTATTENILEHFKDHLRREDAVLFKKLLRSMATLEKTKHGSVWKLDKKFQ